MQSYSYQILPIQSRFAQNLDRKQIYAPPMLTSKVLNDQHMSFSRLLSPKENVDKVHNIKLTYVHSF
jgi:hypothetical protein